MCGRFAMKGSKRDPKDPREVEGFSHLRIIYRGQSLLRDRDRYNIAPRETIGIVRTTAAGVAEEAALWTLIPTFAASPQAWKFSTFNAKAETIRTAASFREAWKRGQRCLVPASALYEWKQVGGEKHPYAICRCDRTAFAFAGLYSERPDGFSVTIITLAPNALFAPLHHRMAMILPRAEYAPWLDPDTPLDRAFALLRPWDPADFEAYRVSSYVSNARHQGSECLEPLVASSP